MNIATAGGTGFIGKVIIKKLVEAGHHVVALIRQGSLLKIASFSGTESRYIYFDSPSTIIKTLEDCQAVVNLIGIIKETKENSFDFAHHLIPMSLVKAAQEAGIKRFIQMSALGVESNLDTEYMRTKRLGENVVKASGLDWTIFRPSVVFGPEDQFVNMFARMIKRLPVVPVIGDGNYRLQPVSVNNIAEAFVKCLDMPKTFQKIYDVAGPNKYTFNEMLDVIGKALGKKRVRKFPQPLWLIQLLANLFGRFSFFPVTTDQIKMLLAENVSDDESFYSDFNITPINFAEGIREYIK
jgi:uncharacterized protein YbjT (DUF2867 family)